MTGLPVLVAGLAAVAAAGAFASACLRLRSPIEFLLAAYALGWAWLVAASLLLSPARVLTRGSLLAALAAGLAVSLAAWLASDRPSPPPFRPGLALAREALRNPAVLILAVAVALGTVYIAALAFFTPANDWDALTYHLARAEFWKQEHGVVLIENTADSRLNAATWGLLLRRPILGNAAAGIGAIALFLTLANYEGKWSGLFFEATIWGNARWEAQTRLSGPGHVHRFVAENVPADARIGVALTGNDHLHPYFGQSLSRNVSLVSGPGADPPADVEWLVLAPGTDVRRCPGAWRPDHTEAGWTVERRVAPDTCLGS